MGPHDASVIANQPDPSFKVSLPVGHHVPDGRPAKPDGVVEVGCAEPNMKSPSEVTREPAQ